MSLFSRFRSGSNSTAASTKSGAPSVDYGPITNEPILTATEYNPILNPSLDEEKEKKIKDLLAYMETIMLDKEDPYYPNEKGFLTEATAHRYMRARKWEFEAAKAMLENTVKWRREFRPDQLDASEIRPEAETGKMYYNGFDKAGRPLWIMKPRYENSKEGERQIKHIVFCLERGIRLMPPQVEKISIVVDFKDSTKASNPNLSTSKKFLDILSNHYPERLGTAFLVNSPWFFLTTFKMVSPFMDPVTKSKIIFLNHDDKSTTNDNETNLEEYIPSKDMEVSLGGRYNFEFDIETYWTRLLEKTGDPCSVIEYK